MNIIPTVLDLNGKECNLFEHEDEQIRKFAVFMLYYAPFIRNKFSTVIKDEYTEALYNDIMTTVNNNGFIYAENSRSHFLQRLTRENISGNNISAKKCIWGMISNSKDKCKVAAFFRHMRNSLAHGNCYYIWVSNKHWFVFDDYSANNKISARVIANQKTLSQWMKISKRYLSEYKEK